MASKRKRSPTPTRLPSHLKPGADIEISSDESGFRGSWYPGTIIRRSSIGNPHKFLVQYTTLFSDDSGKKPLREILEMGQLRPPPTRKRERDFVLGDEVDAYYNDGWWEGVVTEVLDGGEFNVFFRGSKEQIRFGEDDLRVHREWIDGAWKPAFEEEEEEEKEKKVLSKEEARSTKTILEQEFSNGAFVEVTSNKDGFEGSWFSARIIEPRCKVKSRYLVEYQNLRSENCTEPLRKEIDVLHIRPPPPPSEGDIDFVVGERVDAYYNDGWWEGVVTEVLEDGRLGVTFKYSKKKFRFGRQGLRLHREWVSGDWKSPLEEEEEEEEKEKKDSSKAIEGSKRAIAKQEFSNGTLVEVSSDEEGFEGSWFAAKVIEPKRKDKYLVEYKNLRAEDGTLLREEINVLNIRPQPPETVMIGRFSKLEEVDALYNDGWWVGVISKVLTDSKYSVYFRNTEEELKFNHSELRLHQEWIDGKWVTTSQSLKL